LSVVLGHELHFLPISGGQRVFSWKVVVRNWAGSFRDHFCHR